MDQELDAKEQAARWCDFMRRSRTHNLFLRAAYELLGQGLDWPTFIERVKASHDEGEMEPASERIMRELWEGKRQRPTMDPLEYLRQMEAQKEATKDTNGGQDK